MKLHEEFIVIRARAYPDPVSRRTFGEARRFRDENGGQIRRRLVSDWVVVVEEPCECGALAVSLSGYCDCGRYRAEEDKRIWDVIHAHG
jgi:hypothetical protein